MLFHPFPEGEHSGGEGGAGGQQIDIDSRNMENATIPQEEAGHNGWPVMSSRPHVLQKVYIVDLCSKCDTVHLECKFAQSCQSSHTCTLNFIKMYFLCRNI